MLQEDVHVENPVRCAICGKLIEIGEVVVEMKEGKLRKEEVVAQKDWGVAHKACFNRAMPSPKAALEEIRRLSKAG